MRCAFEAALARDKEPRLHYLMGTILRERQSMHKRMRNMSWPCNTRPVCRLASPAMPGLRLKARQAEPFIVGRSRAHSIYRYHNNFGFSLYLQGRFEEAVKSYEEAIELNPNASIAFINLGFALAVGDDKPAASL